MSRPRTSLCMIARDEAEFLPGCLASVAGAVDEIVLADTGSVDGTAEIARRAGARVVSFPWRDDFSAARNAALAEARGEVILVLDADERLAPGAGRAINAFAACLHPAGTLRLHDASRLDATPAEVLSGAARMGAVNPLVRLLRRLPGLAYEGALHEHVTAFVARHGNAVAACDGDIVHLGGVPQLRERRGKRLRNVRLLRKRWDADRSDLEAAAHLALELRAAGALQDAWAVVCEAWPLRAQARDRNALRLAVARALLLLAANQPDEALATVADEEPRSRGHPELMFLRGVALDARARGLAGEARRRELAGAEAAFRSALSGTAHRLLDSIQGARGYVARSRLAGVLLLLGQRGEARAEIQAALAESPGHLPARLTLAELDLLDGRPSAALEALEPVLGAVADAWWLASRAAAALGAADDARLFADRARSDGRGFVAWHRAEEAGVPA